jgi:hypothetical protein
VKTAARDGRGMVRKYVRGSSLPPTEDKWFKDGDLGSYMVYLALIVTGSISDPEP